MNPIVVPFDYATGSCSHTRRLAALTSLSYSVWYLVDLFSWTEYTIAVTGTLSINSAVETVPVIITTQLLTLT